MTFRSLSFFVPFLLLAGCGGTDAATGDAGNDAAGDASTSDALVADAAAADASSSDASGSDATQACNAIANTAQLIPMDYIAQAPPTGQGGTIVDGTYTMTAAGFYTGVGGVSGTSGVTGQVTIQITGNTIQVATKGTPPHDHLTTTVVTSGATLTRTDTCPDTTSQQGTFTATATSLVVVLPAGTFPDGGVKTLVETFTKQ